MTTPGHTHPATRPPGSRDNPRLAQRAPFGIEMLILRALAVRLLRVAREHGKPARAEAA
jgi:hypothetical protein